MTGVETGFELRLLRNSTLIAGDASSLCTHDINSLKIQAILLEVIKSFKLICVEICKLCMGWLFYTYLEIIYVEMKR